MTWGHLSKYRSELMGIACLWIMLYHNRVNWPDALEPVRRFVDYVNLGVEIFLLLSGISMYFSWQKQPPLREFYRRRLVRLAVPYVLLALPYWVWRDVYEGIGDFWLNLTQLSLPLQGIIPTWYIPAAAVLYLCYPLIVRWIFAGNCRLRTSVLCSILVAGCAGLHYSGSTIYQNCEIALTRSVIFVSGCCLGRTVYENRPMSRRALPLSLVWLLVNSLLRQSLRLERVWRRFSYVPLCLAVCVVLVYLLEKFQTRNSLRRFLRFFGKHSLEMYLTHMLLRNVVYHYIPATCLDPWGFVSYGLILAAAVALSTLLHPLMERLCGMLLGVSRKEKPCAGIY